MFSYSLELQTPKLGAPSRDTQQFAEIWKTLELLPKGKKN
jgi:hypothetical protein